MFNPHNPNKKIINVGKLMVKERASRCDQNAKPDRFSSAFKCLRTFTVMEDVTGDNER